MTWEAGRGWKGRVLQSTGDLRSRGGVPCDRPTAVSLRARWLCGKRRRRCEVGSRVKIRVKSLWQPFRGFEDGSDCLCVCKTAGWVGEGRDGVGLSQRLLWLCFSQEDAVTRRQRSACQVSWVVGDWGCGRVHIQLLEPRSPKEGTQKCHLHVLSLSDNCSISKCLEKHWHVM